jgi:predicted RNase H-like HicB family nuclease/predicted HTH domain antitoxin
MTPPKLTVLVEPAEEGGFVVKCLELPVVSEGETKEEALSNIKEAIEGYLEVKAKLLDGKANSEKAEVTVEIEDSVEKVIVKGLPKVSVSKEEREEIKHSIEEIKNGNCVALEELSGVAELEKEKAAKLYMEGKISISGAAETARLTIPEMVDYLVCKGFKSEYSVEDFRRGATLLEKKLKPRKIKN